MTPERALRIKQVLDKRQPDLCVVLENVQDPRNISAVMRTCDSVGVQNLFILNTRTPRHEKFKYRSAASAASWLTTRHFDQVNGCFNEVRSRCEFVYATHLGKAARSLYDLNLSGSVALVFGNEHSGLSQEALDQCDGNFHIPQVGMVRSLNISVACAVSLYEAFRQRLLAGLFDSDTGRLAPDTRNALAAQWGVQINEQPEAAN